MFGWDDFGEDGKIRGGGGGGNRRENGWEERGERKLVEPSVFSLGPPKLNLPKLRRFYGSENMGKSSLVLWEKITPIATFS